MAVAARPDDDELEAVILAEIDAGVMDPHVVATNIVRVYGNGWVASQLLERAHVLIAGIARQYMGTLRRASVEQGGVVVVARETRLQRHSRSISFLDLPVYLGGGTWKANGDLTAHDSRAMAAKYRQRIAQLTVWAERYERFASLIEEQSVECLREVEGWEEAL